MNFVSYNKYKQYLESFGYVEDGQIDHSDMSFITHSFKKEDVKLCYMVNEYTNNGVATDKVMSINHGYGSIYVGWNSVKIDFRTKFWKNLMYNV